MTGEMKRLRVNLAQVLDDGDFIALRLIERFLVNLILFLGGTAHGAAPDGYGCNTAALYADIP